MTDSTTPTPADDLADLDNAEQVEMIESTGNFLRASDADLGQPAQDGSCSPPEG